MELSTKQVCYLRSLAHKLSPVVQMGKAGYSAAFVKEVERNLADHELIKVRIGVEESGEFVAVADQLAEDTGAVLVQTIGRIAVFYRAAEEPQIHLPIRKPVSASTGA